MPQYCHGYSTDARLGFFKLTHYLLFDVVLRIAFGVSTCRDLDRRSTRSQYFVYSSEKFTRLRWG